MSIDWSKAPEGATHYSKRFSEFYKAEDGFLLNYQPDEMRWIVLEDWHVSALNSGHLAMIERPESTEPKRLTQAVFDGLPIEYRWAAISSDGRAHAHKCTPKGATEASWWCVRGCAVYLIGDGCDTTNWQNSLIERQDVSGRVEQLRSVEEARQVEVTLAERQNQYGDFKDVAHLSQGLQSLLSVGNFSDTQQEAIQMICSKLARLACGDADHVDSWHDIAGYATLVVKDLESGK